MIKYKLICNNCNFLFNSWFSSSADYEKLKKNCYDQAKKLDINLDFKQSNIEGEIVNFIHE